MSGHAYLLTFLRLWFSGVISEVSDGSPEELGFCTPLWSPSDPSFGCRPGLYLSPRSCLDDFDTSVIDAFFSCLACLIQSTFVPFHAVLLSSLCTSFLSFVSRNDPEYLLVLWLLMILLPPYRGLLLLLMLPLTM
jgi:hypothetical protein